MIAGLVLAGGAARRMGGVDKLALVVDGVTLLDRVLGAARPLCDLLVAVGPERPTVVEGVRFIDEATPSGGPVPAIAAGLSAAGPADVVLVLAGDLPRLSTGLLIRLVDRLGDGTDAVAALDGAGRPIPLLAAYRAGALADRLAGLGPDLAGMAARRLLPDDVALVDLGPQATLNVNTPDDLDRARSAGTVEYGRSTTTGLPVARVGRTVTPDDVRSLEEDG